MPDPIVIVLSNKRLNMGLLSRIFHRSSKETKTGGMEDYMTLVRVYFQASLATELGINNLGMLPDLRTFKATLHVPTQNNKLGVGEKSHCKKMMKDIYQTNDKFFKEVDQSIRKNCKKIQDVQTYMIQFQGFSQDLMMLLGNLMKYKLRVPSFFKSAVRKMTEKTVDDILHKNDFSDAEVVRTAMSIRQYNKRLGFSQEWITDFVFQIVMLAKKESPNTSDDNQ